MIFNVYLLLLAIYSLSSLSEENNDIVFSADCRKDTITNYYNLKIENKSEVSYHYHISLYLLDNSNKWRRIYFNLLTKDRMVRDKGVKYLDIKSNIIEQKIYVNDIFNTLEEYKNNIKLDKIIIKFKLTFYKGNEINNKYYLYSPEFSLRNK